MQKKIRQLPILFLILAISPFVVGFESPDSSGTYAKFAGGRGAFHMSGCHRAHDVDFWEGYASVKHRFDTRSKSGLTPDVSVGAAAGIIPEKRTLVKVDTPYTGTIGTTEQHTGYAGSAFVALEWRWLGLNAGVTGINAWIIGNDSNYTTRTFVPGGGIRIGPWKSVYVTAEVYNDEPFFTGGGWIQMGIGGKFFDTKLWVGEGGIPYTNAAVLKAAHAWGPLEVSFIAQGNPKNIPPANIGIDHEYGVSLGLEYRIPNF